MNDGPTHICRVYMIFDLTSRGQGRPPPGRERAAIGSAAAAGRGFGAAHGAAGQGCAFRRWSRRNRASARGVCKGEAEGGVGLCGLPHPACSGLRPPQRSEGPADPAIASACPAGRRHRQIRKGAAGPRYIKLSKRRTPYVIRHRLALRLPVGERCGDGLSGSTALQAAPWQQHLGYSTLAMDDPAAPRFPCHLTFIVFLPCSCATDDD